VTVKLPVVLVKIIPFAPPLPETLVSDTTSGVVLTRLSPTISTGIALVELIVPLVVVIVPVLLVA
jgi:hypothetical protein